MADTILPGVVDHLWQTTLVVAILALLTCTLNRNAARLRYWVWLAASVKFLVPFSVAASVGQLFVPRDFPVSTSPAPITSIAFQIATSVASFPGAGIPAQGSRIMSWLQTHSTFLLVAWAAGFLTLVCAWLIEWIRMRALVRASAPSNRQFAVPVRVSGENVEPGIAGIFTPVLILPRSMEDLLRPEQMAAILAHEQCHLRRRDNLTAALHRFVQSIFWFHPAVWAIAGRLVVERERACDEQVLHSGHAPEGYAEGILTLCELCVRRRPPAMAPIGGGKLKDRIAAIVHGERPHELDLGRKLLMLVAAIATVVVPISAVALAPATVSPSARTPSAVEVGLRNLSIAGNTAIGLQMLKMGSDGRLEATNLPIRNLIAAAYGVPVPQVTSLNQDIEPRFDISAETTAPPRAAQSWRNALKGLLTTRFRLETRIERRSVSGYALRVSGGGLKIRSSTSPGGLVSFWQESMTVTGLPLSFLTDYFSNSLGVPVSDETGLSGGFSYTLRVRPSSLDTQPWTGIGPALEDQLGLTLERKTVTAEFVEVVAVHPPTN